MFKNVYWDAINLAHYKGTAVEENHYYPFGLTLNAANPSSGVPLSDIRYNSKKLERDEFGNGLGLDWYDYGERAYDPQIGRWNQVDPLASKYPNLSPNNFVANNPILHVDPNGKEIILFYKDKNDKTQRIYLIHKRNMKAIISF